jgi:hypothetical protein
VEILVSVLAVEVPELVALVVMEQEAQIHLAQSV